MVFSVSAGKQDAAHLAVVGGESTDPVYECRKITDPAKGFKFSRLWIDGVDGMEVTSWIAGMTTGKVDFKYEESKGDAVLVHFTFHNSADALKFKLCFAEGLEAGAVAY
jgi:hypothetical protein